MTKNSLLPDYYNCGRSINNERHFTKKTGRPPQYPSSLKRGPVTDEWKDIFKKSLEKFYFLHSKPSLQHSYEQMLKRYFTVKDNETGYQVLDVNEPIPSYEQYRYWYRKWYKNKGKDVIRRREGNRMYIQKYRSITGSATEDAMGVGLYAVDATIGDVYLVSETNRKAVIGRSVIYLCVDNYSKCITGISVGIENMSNHAIRIALANTFENKKEYCKRVLDLDISEEDWPIHYLPHTLLADRGSELISDSITDVAESLNIKFQNAGGYRPELKGVVERYIGMVQKHVQPFLPGSVHGDFKERGLKDHRKKAVLKIGRAHV